ncbi:MAG: glutamyl-tRNA reductase [Acidobacteriia bacterium]|nr:glutamyl-tRNA reductase [Terriglobia bacterium]
MNQKVPTAVLGNCLVCGVSYQRTPIEVRERISIPGHMLADALQHLMSLPAVQECMILSTCNRTEIYLSAPEWWNGRESFCRLVRAVRGFDMADLQDQIYVLRGAEAVKHSFRVASSLDSLVLGEPQILGQFKDAFRAAENQGCIDRELHRWIPRVFAAAKQVRSETGICDAAVSISYAAVQLARKIFEDLAGKSVVLLGAGRMGELAALHLREAGARSIIVINRTPARAEEVAARCSGTAMAYERREEQIAGADVVICSTDAPQYVLLREDARRILYGRSDRPLLLLDISLPRNVDPGAGELKGIYLFNIDDLESVVQANRRNRQAAAARAELILQKALEHLLHDEKRSQMAPAIAAIRNQVRSLCMAELDRLAQRMPEMSLQEREELELMLHRIAQKIVHPAIMELKAIDAVGDGRVRQSLVEKLFGIHRETADSRQ